MLITAPTPYEPLTVDDVTLTTVGDGFSKAALTVRAALIVTTQEPVPVHAPLQPVNVLPVPGFAESVTGVLKSYTAEQVAPQLIPEGLLVTVPRPVPDLVTVKK